MRVDRWPRLPVRRAARAIVMASALAAPAAVLSAQSATTAAPHAVKHRKPRAAAAAKNTTTAQAAAPVAPPAPNWPVNDAPAHAAVTWDSRALHIQAANSSLLAILADVSSATGTKITGAGQDHRIFGNYGPGPARDVLSQLFEGLGYNVLMTGENDLGVPREVQLSTRSGGSSTPASMPMGRPQPPQQPDDDYVDDTPAPEPEPPTPQPPNQQDEQRQQLLQPGQQPGQPPQQQPNN